MDAVTYPNKQVIDYIQGNMVPVKILHDKQPYASRFNVTWTPTLIVLDDHENEVYHSEGFLRPIDLIPALMLATAKAHLAAGRYKEAIASFSRVTSTYPKSEEAPEAIYYEGVASFKMKKDIRALREAYKRLAAEYPHSSWTTKAEPYK